jgi:hypothetical protein
MTQGFNHDIHPKTLKQECMQYIYLLTVGSNSSTVAY